MPSFPALQSLNHRWIRLPLHRRGSIAAVIPTFCLLLSLSAFTGLRQSTEKAQKYVNTIEGSLLQSQEVLIALINAETGMRGYRITGQREFLEPYNNTLVRLPSLVQELARTPQNTPEQQQRLEVLIKLSQSRLDTLRKGVDQIPIVTNAAERSQELALLKQGKLQMDFLRQQISDFQTEQRRLLQVQKDDLQQQEKLTTWVLWICAGISVLGSLLAICLFARLEQELKQRERRLSESKVLIQSITSNVVDGIVTLDAEGVIETVNPAATEMFDYSPEAVINRSLSILLTTPNSNQAKTKSEVWDNPADYSGARLQTFGYRRDGTAFPVEVTLSSIPLEDRLIAIIRDMSEQQQAKAALQARAEELAQLNEVFKATNVTLEARNQELNQFAYIASHDLKAPLRAIANLSTWLEEDLGEQLPVENRQQIDLLRGRVNRMEALINGLLAYSRAGRTEAVVEPVEVASLLEEILDSFAPPTFTIEIQPTMPTLQARRIPLRQVFANLIENAIKHHPRIDGQITISAQDRGTAYEFAIADDGEGIDTRYHEKVFTIFQTLEARDKKESTGVGLSIVKKIVEAEGGRVWIHSAVGSGAAFHFTWPKSALR